MERIRRILAAMTKAEVRYLRTFLDAFSGKGEDNKALRLIDMLLAYPDTSPEDACEMLYEMPSSAAFKMLVSRLEDRMLESLQLDTSLSKNETLKNVPIEQARVKLYQHMSQALILYNRNLIPEAGEMFQQIAREANLFGLYEVKLTALHYYHITTLRGGWTDEMIREQREAFEQYQAVFEGQLTNNTVSNMQHMMSGDATEVIEKYLVNKLPHLQQLVEKADAPLATYLYLQQKRMYAQLTDDLAGEEKALDEMLALTENSKLLQLTKRILSVRHEKASLMLRMYRFAECLEQGTPLLTEFKADKRGSIRSYLAYASYYLCKWDESLRHLGDLSPRMQHLSDYLKACIAWQTDNVKLAKKNLLQCSSLHDDKSGWNMGLRTFEIILLIDSGEQDLATARIESQRKHIERYKVEAREIHINRYLRALERNAYDFTRPTKEMNAHLEQILASRWYALSHEAIRFDAWATSHTNAVPYLQVFRQITIPLSVPVQQDSQK